ncbi:hypothetical protein EIN_173800 [Entamoeba invadens IP1]|uniref:TLDc domain-containing protein n=1 Tax=Entamoeba invadens IP1 TaxID=370355 RepID=A0A0A1TYQ9_ENTIV|nr:hypothetical protein EIN_173800 [Entamoeba invadens IP1]ELP84705.1 hypothetical protein EIN_173800 [Entamoeba invadens IP1]|eukprot:XP_004184051.1 hypothetical protein EIN_173800 [Entamoeba invadens IP1]
MTLPTQFNTDLQILEDTLATSEGNTPVESLIVLLIKQLNLRLQVIESTLPTQYNPSPDILDGRKQCGLVNRNALFNTKSPQKRLTPETFLKRRRTDLDLTSVEIKSPPSPDRMPNLAQKVWVASKPKIEPSGVDFINAHKRTLQMWTNKKMYKVIYSSITDGFSSEALNDRIVGVNNVMVLVKDDKQNVFGAFSHQQPIQPNHDDFSYNDSDDTFFVFSINNTKGSTPVKFCKRGVGPAFRTSDEDNIIFAVADCFTLRQSNTSYIHPHFKKYFNTNEDATVFNGTVFPIRFTVEKLVAVQWF